MLNFRRHQLKTSLALAATLLGLFAIVMWRTWRTARLARDFYGTLVCAAIFAMFGFQIQRTLEAPASVKRL